MKNIIITLWVIGVVLIALAAALNPFADNSSSDVTPAGRSRSITVTSRWMWQVVIIAAVVGFLCIVAGAVIFWYDVWVTIR